MPFISQNGTSGVQVEITGWQGATMPELIAFLERKTRVKVTNAQVQGIKVCGSVRSQAEADSLMNWNGVRFAGNALKFSKAQSVQNPQTVNTVEMLKGFLLRRYNADAKLLDLTNISSDALLQQNGLFSSISTQSKMFPALMKLASNESFIVESVSLSDNNLTDLNGVTTLAQTYPDLINLSLANNRISKLSSLDIWKNKFRRLREVILANNPISTDPNYKNEVLKVFPKAVLLDGIAIRDEMKLQAIYQLPINKKQFFFEDSQIQGIATQFLANFLNLWDSDRSQLLQLYQEQSQFSVSVDSAAPNDAMNTTSFGYYIPFSRNLARVSSEQQRKQRLGKGPEQIHKLFQQIPKSKHSLTEKPNLYSVEAWRFPQVQGFIISLHGSFDEVAKPEHDATQNNRGSNRRFSSQSNAGNRPTPKSFDRTFVIVPISSGLVIASDLLIVRPVANANSWAEDLTGTVPTSSAGVAHPHPSVPEMAQTPQPQEVAQLVQTMQLPPNITPLQRDIVARLHLQTKLNLQFTVMLAEQSGWDFNAAIQQFHQSHTAGQIPPEAFT